MIQEKKYQIEAVEALVKKTIKLLEAPEDRKSWCSRLLRALARP